MSEINPVSSGAEAQQAQQTENLVQAQQQSSASKKASETFVSDTANLKEKAPEVHKALVESIARNVLRGMREHEARRKKIAREGQR